LCVHLGRKQGRNFVVNENIFFLGALVVDLEELDLAVIESAS
jgi:hypothetical protein